MSEQAPGSSRFHPLPRSARKPEGEHPDALFEREFEKIVRRIRAVQDADRADFVDGSLSYDHATLVVLRLAAMLEPASPFSGRFEALGKDARRGIVTTRNILSHSGYGALDEDVFWRTVAVDIPRALRDIGFAI